MANFAEIDSNNIVIRVLAVDDSLEDRGAEFLANDLGLGGTWIQTSYNGNIRKQYAGIGYTYDANADVFISPQPHLSWILDSNYDWQAPTLIPTDDKFYEWDEATTSWVEATSF